MNETDRTKLHDKKLSNESRLVSLQLAQLEKRLQNEKQAKIKSLPKSVYLFRKIVESVVMLIVAITFSWFFLRVYPEQMEQTKDEAEKAEKEKTNIKDRQAELNFLRDISNVSDQKLRRAITFYIIAKGDSSGESKYKNQALEYLQKISSPDTIDNIQELEKLMEIERKEKSINHKIVSNVNEELESLLMKIEDKNDTDLGSLEEKYRSDLKKKVEAINQEVNNMKLSNKVIENALNNYIKLNHRIITPEPPETEN